MTITDTEIHGDILLALADEPITYQVAVPSYERAHLIGGRTLATLDRLGVDRDCVTIFVADTAQAEEYATLDGWRVQVACPGLDACRKWYANEHYPAGTRIINIDDDVDDLLTSYDGKKLVSWDGRLDTLATIGFGMASVVGARLWGIASAANAFYMADEAVAGLRYLCGILFGSIAGDAASMDPAVAPVSSGADFERSLRSFVTYGSVVRVNWLAPKTKYFGEGGMQAELGGPEQRARDHASALRAIALRYPKLAKIKTKAGGVTNLRLKPETTVRVSRSSLEAAALRT